MVIVDVNLLVCICQEEIFGLVVIIIFFSDWDEVILIVNDFSYGLVGYIWIGFQDIVYYVSYRLQMGMIWINLGFDCDLCQLFGGMKNSGFGREGGNFSCEFFIEI